MDNYSKDIVKKLVERAKLQVISQKDAEIKALKDELESYKLEKELNSEYKEQPQKENVVKDEEIDKILGGLYE